MGALLGFAVGVTLLTHHLTAVYLGLIYVLLLLRLLRRPDSLRRIGRLILSGLIALAMSGWAFWRSRHAIYGYYWVGHFTDREGDLRSSHFGLASSASWMARELLGNQVGLAALGMGAFLAIALVASARLGAKGDAPECRSGEPMRDAWATALIFFAVPAGVLLLHPEKSHAPLEVVIPAVVWVIVLCWIRAARGAGHATVTTASVICCIAGASVFAGSQLRSPYPRQMEEEYRGVNALGDFLVFRSEEAGLTRPRVAVTWWLDGLNAESFELMSRERHGRQLRFMPMLPTGLLEAEPKAIMDRLGDSDFVCLVTRATASWPFDRQMPAMLPRMQAWCESNMTRDGSLETQEFSVTVFERSGLEKTGGCKGRRSRLNGDRCGKRTGICPRGPARCPAAGRSGCGFVDDQGGFPISN